MKNVARYQSIIRSSTDSGYVIGIFSQKTGECEQDDEGFNEVAELNRLFDENQQLRRRVVKLMSEKRALTKVARGRQFRAPNPSLTKEKKP